jgi:cytochrome P450
VFEVSRDWRTFSSEIGGFVALKNAILPLELQQAMFIGMDPPKHDGMKALFQRGFTPKRIAEHENPIRVITTDVFDRLDGRDICDLVSDVAQPAVARVIGSFMGLPPEDDEVWANLINVIVGAGDPDAKAGWRSKCDRARGALGVRAVRQADRRTPRVADK